ncbi:MAG: YggS family pyridoxal phosphate-dependent enzyme [Oscillospiraceae bacterium]|nr:YggS family pyridoxal phosphate-dependent enzyme [Oscillospiraceae bacterium]
MNVIAENVARIREEMARAEAQAGRPEGSVQLLAATKMNGAEQVRAAIAAGVDACGENRVQELVEKNEQSAYTGAPLHFIGHLQKNKAKFLVGVADLIQSVDSPELMAVINRLAEKKGVVQDILIEVNIGGETAKSGILPEQADEMSAKMEEYPNLCLRGFMTIPPIAVENGGNLRYFAKMYQLYVDIKRKKYDNTNIEYLSMGMSDDFADAIKEGTTMIRVGTRIFGARQYVKK